jgi:uncharacterized membrane protein
MPIVLITALGAFLRFFHLGHQGLWYDETFSAWLVNLPLGRMLGQLPIQESTPPLYYGVAWFWTRIFGDTTLGLRSLSAVVGTATIPIAYASARKLLPGRRPALILAALTACNPFLIWYSQEARAYEMLVFVSALTVLTFAYARERPRRLALSLWAVACAAALATEYYAVLVVIPQAIWLIYEHRHKRWLYAALGFIALIGAALVPLVIAQNKTNHDAWIGHISLTLRLEQVSPMFLLGPQTHLRILLKFIGFAVVLAAIALLLFRSARRERQGALAAVILGVGGFILSLLIIPASDTFLSRNIIDLWLPLAMIVAAGLGVARARLIGAGLALVLCAIGITAVISVDTDYWFGRPNWQAVATEMGSWPAPTSAHPKDVRLVLLQQNPGRLPLGLYMPNLNHIDTKTVPNVSEIYVIAINGTPKGLGSVCWWGSACNLVASRLKVNYGIPGFHNVRRFRIKQFDVLELAADKPTTVSRRRLMRTLPHHPNPWNTLLIQK